MLHTAEGTSGARDTAGQDMALTLSVVLSGPALICCAQVMLEGALSAGSLRSTEQLLGLAAAGAGVLLSLFGALSLSAAILHAILDAVPSRDGAGARRPSVPEQNPRQNLVQNLPVKRLRRTAGGGRSHGRTALAQLSPAFMRRACAAALGTSLALLGTTAGAAPESPAEPLGSVSALFPAEEPFDSTPDDAQISSPAPETAFTAHEEVPMTPLFRPTPPPGSDRLKRLPQREAEDAEEIVVRSGDSLWSIVAEHMGPGATDWEVARQWPEWHRANRDVIGADPSLITPGMVLTAPPES